MNGTPSRSFKGSLLASGTADEGGGPPVSFRLIDARSGLRQSRFIGARAAPQERLASDEPIAVALHPWHAATSGTK